MVNLKNKQTIKRFDANVLQSIFLEPFDNNTSQQYHHQGAPHHPQPSHFDIWLHCFHPAYDPETVFGLVCLLSVCFPPPKHKPPFRLNTSPSACHTTQALNS